MYNGTYQIIFAAFSRWLVPGKRGYKEVFNPITVAADLNAAGTSEMAGNFFWQNSFVTPLARIPFKSHAIELLQDMSHVA